MSEALNQLLIPPNLGNVITAADITQKGDGSYAADYVNWCRTAQLLRENAPGWQFHLRLAPDGQHVWRAPNGTGYVVGFFEGPDGTTTPDFPQSVMNNRNQAVLLDKIDARDVTDTHRRCLCTAAAAQFGLAWQLWAKEPVENPHREVEGDAPPAPGSQRSSSQRTRQPGSSAPRQSTSAVVRRGPPAGQPAPATQSSSTTAPPSATTQPLSGPAATTAAAIKACQESGLTDAGIAAMALEISKGKYANIAGLSVRSQEKFITDGVPAEFVAKWNAAGAWSETEAGIDAALSDYAEADPPMTWGAPVAA
jgi:hypothetical protein